MCTVEEAEKAEQKEEADRKEAEVLAKEAEEAKKQAESAQAATAAKPSPSPSQVFYQVDFTQGSQKLGTLNAKFFVVLTPKFHKMVFETGPNWFQQVLGGI